MVTNIFLFNQVVGSETNGLMKKLTYQFLFRKLTKVPSQLLADISIQPSPHKISVTIIIYLERICFFYNLHYFIYLSFHIVYR